MELVRIPRPGSCEAEPGEHMVGPIPTVPTSFAFGLTTKKIRGAAKTEQYQTLADACAVGKIDIHAINTVGSARESTEVLKQRSR